MLTNYFDPQKGMKHNRKNEGIKTNNNENNPVEIKTQLNKGNYMMVMKQR